MHRKKYGIESNKLHMRLLKRKTELFQEYKVWSQMDIRLVIHMSECTNTYIKNGTEEFYIDLPMMDEVIVINFKRSHFLSKVGRY